MSSQSLYSHSETAKDSVQWPEGSPSPEQFTARVWEQGKAHFRDLPWRFIDDAYGVLVSEIMLQQTQVARVMRYWERFMALFPTLDALAAADTAVVLEQWQGLGYNRRALYLKQCAEQCAATFGGELPSTLSDLLRLPGIGPTTAAGVMAFAYNQPAVYLETNVRTVFLHDLFPKRDQVADRELRPLVEATCPLDCPRDWYYALLDYGAALKADGDTSSRRSSHYTRQSPFTGSRRQKRAWILRQVLAAGMPEVAQSDSNESEDGAPEGRSPATRGVSFDELHESLNVSEQAQGRPPVSDELFESIVSDLVSEGFFNRSGGILFTD